MSYCSLQDVIDRLSATGLIYVADDDGDGTVSGPETTAAIVASILAADAEIDAALVGRTTLPISSPGDWLRHRGIDLAAERLAERKGHGVPISLAEAARRSREWLEEVRTGKRLVPGVTFAVSRTADGTSPPGFPRVVNPSLSAEG